MSLPLITGLYAALMGIGLFALDLHVGLLRNKHRVSVYDGGHKDLGVAIRRQGNFTEHVPVVLILMGLVEMNGAPGWSIHAFGLALVVARLAHPFGLDADNPALPARAVGALLTSLVTLVASGLAIWQFIGA